MRLGFGGVAGRPFCSGQARRAPSDRNPTAAAVARLAGLNRPARKAAFPAQAQVFGPGARGKRRAALMGQAEIGPVNKSGPD